MKEIWKLLELLNEYDSWWDYDDYYWPSEEFYGENWDLEIISKKFWFIKWLVENDKIDLDKVREKSDFFPVEKVPEYNSYSDYESLLMLLAISDTPIEDLLLYLK